METSKEADKKSRGNVYVASCDGNDFVRIAFHRYIKYKGEEKVGRGCPCSSREGGQSVETRGGGVNLRTTEREGTESGGV